MLPLLLPLKERNLLTLHPQICNWKCFLASIYNNNQKEENTKTSRFSKAYEHLCFCKVIWCFYSHLQKVHSTRSSVNDTQKQLFKRPFYKQNKYMTFGGKKKYKSHYCITDGAFLKLLVIKKEFLPLKSNSNANAYYRNGEHRTFLYLLKKG